MHRIPALSLHSAGSKSPALLASDRMTSGILISGPSSLLCELAKRSIQKERGSEMADVWYVVNNPKEEMIPKRYDHVSRGLGTLPAALWLSARGTGLNVYEALGNKVYLGVMTQVYTIFLICSS